MPIDKSYLAKHGPSWRVQVAVPKDLQPILKAKVLFASTKTDSLALGCLVSAFDGASLSSDSKDALWARFCMGAPQRQGGPSSDTA